MSYEVQVIADSIAPHGGRITTFQLKYPRIIHSELMTHRVLSRNASSSRAIPTAKMIEWVERDPAMPVYWGKNARGMQATEELGEAAREYATDRWLLARDEAVRHCKALMEAGVHKQIASRILEPWAHINVIVTATTFDNFFALRCHKAAMPEIQALAVKMARAYRDSQPIPLEPGWWHLPYVTPDELADLCEVRRRGNLSTLHEATSRCLKFSTARCARVSYLTFDGKAPDPESDVKLHDQLRDNGHWSPFEHPAQAMDEPFRSGNFLGWRQYRQTLAMSVHRRFDYAILDEYGDRDFIV